ncbi:MAG: Gfo/Idh/MocA family oxidoreductase, partial [Candidatus Latescibacteria bacterium]|nr:Gfo/Idh/MocA family oxidoreductase [Candidatus Latescibacterota bacterium]
MGLRCGVIGLNRGKLFVKALAANEHCDVVAVCDPDEKVLADLSGLETFTEIEPFLGFGLDVVAVISPGPVHAAQSVAAMEQGAHVLTETPCVYSLQEARQVVETAARTGRRYMLAENYIWMGWAMAFKQLIEEGKLGEIVYAEGDYTHDCRDLMFYDDGERVPYSELDKHPDATPAWRATDLPPLLYCSHTLGPMLHLMGDRIVSAFGFGVEDKGMPGRVPTDLESALFQTETGATIRLTNGFALAH